MIQAIVDLGVKKCHLLDILDDYYDNRFDVEFEVVITDTER